MAVLFVIPVVIDVYGHRFELFTLVSEIHDDVDLVLGIENVFELEGVLHIQDSSFKNKQIHTILFKGTGNSKTKRKEVYKNRSTIYR